MYLIKKIICTVMNSQAFKFNTIIQNEMPIT